MQHNAMIDELIPVLLFWSVNKTIVMVWGLGTRLTQTTTVDTKVSGETLVCHVVGVVIRL